MNKRQHIVQQQFLNNEAAVFKRLKTAYNQSSKDINAKIKELDLDIAGLKSVWDNFEGSEDEKAELLSRIQSKIYQKQYQQAIQGQVDGILKDLQNNTYKSISEYLEKSYEDGFIGTMYSLQGQGIPLIMPLDQEAMVRAVQLDSKISKGLYNHLGENVGMLKKHITAQVSRGIANGYSYEQVAQQLALKMKGTYNNAGGALAYAMRIARTEGHRIQIQGAMDACYKAKDMGADVVKQWDSTLDDSTRESHIAVDGEIRELDEEFSNGLMFPGDPSGKAAEVINCRCALLERARWALDESELETLQKRAEFFGVDKTDSFEEYKKKYLKASEQLTNSDNGATKTKLTSEVAELETKLADLDKELENALTLDEMIRIDAKRDEVLRKLDEIRSEKAKIAKQKRISEAKEIVEDSGLFKKVSLEGCDPETAEAIASAVEKVKLRYPMAQFDEISISTESMSGSVVKNTEALGKTIHSTSYNKGGSKTASGTSVKFNGAYFRNGTELADIQKSQYVSGFSATGTTEGIITHEFGHALCKNYDISELEIYRSVITELGMDYRKAYGGTSKEAYQSALHISKYGEVSTEEWFAECFADYMTNSNPKNVSIMAVETFDKMLVKKARN